jgi:hypothetical protein
MDQTISTPFRNSQLRKLKAIYAKGVDYHSKLTGDEQITSMKAHVNYPHDEDIQYYFRQIFLSVCHYKLKSL